MADEIMRELNDSIKDLDSTIKGLNMSILGNASNSAANGLRRLSSDLKETEGKFGTFGRNLAETGKTTVKALDNVKDVTLSFGKAMLDSTNNFSKFGSSINQAAKAVESFGAIGKGIGILLKPITMLTDSILGAVDTVFEAKDSLAQIGAVGSLTASDIRKLGEGSGFAVSQLGQYSKIVKSIGPGLVSLGGNVNEGVLAFAKLTEVTSEQRQAFQRLGVSQEQLTQNQADYIRMQSMSGVIMTDQFRRSDQLKKASIEYTENLLVLSALTGEDVETIKKKQEQQLSEMDIQARFFQMSNEAKRLEEQGRKDEADALRKRIDTEQQLIKTTSTEFGPALSDAIRNFVATGGQLNEVSAPLAALGLPLDQLAEKLRNGEDVTALFVTETKNAVGRMVDSTGTLLGHSKEFAQRMGITSKDIQSAARGLGHSYVEQTKQAKESIEANKNRESQLAKDPMETARNTLTESMITVRQKFDELVKRLTDYTLPAIPTIAKGMVTLVENLERVAKEIYEFGRSVMFVISELKVPEKLAENWKEIALGATALIAAIKVRSMIKGQLGSSKANAVWVQSSDSILGGMKGSRGSSMDFPLWVKIVPKGYVSPADVDKKNQRPTQRKGGGRGRLPSLGNIARTAGRVAGTAARFAGGLTGAAVTGYAVGETFVKPALDKGAQALTGEKDATLGTMIANWFKQDPNKAANELMRSTAMDKFINFTSMSGSKDNFTKMDPEVQMKVLSAAADYYQKTGNKIQINSSKRTIEDQQRLYDESIKEGRPGKTSSGMPIARPDSAIGSAHIRGTAVDIQNYTDPLAIEMMNKYGLFQTVPKDPVHFQLPKARYGGMFSGPDSGYPVELHGNELITPLSANSLLEKMATTSANNNSELVKAMTPNTAPVENTTQMADIQMRIMNMIGDKLDNMIGKLSESNDIQEKLLQYSRS